MRSGRAVERHLPVAVIRDQRSFVSVDEAVKVHVVGIVQGDDAAHESIIRFKFQVVDVALFKRDLLALPVKGERLVFGVMIHDAVFFFRYLCHALFLKDRNELFLMSGIHDVPGDRLASHFFNESGIRIPDVSCKFLDHFEESKVRSDRIIRIYAVISAHIADPVVGSQIVTQAVCEIAPYVIVPQDVKLEAAANVSVLFEP